MPAAKRGPSRRRRQHAKSQQMRRVHLAAGAFVVLLVALVIWAIQRGRTTAIVVVAAIAVVLTILSWGLFKDKNESRLAKLLGLKEAGLRNAEARELGSSLLTGLVVAVSVMLLQIILDIAREKDAREEQLRLSIGVSQDLAGLDAHGSSLSEISLAGKNLDRADLSDSNLSNANLEGASLREADLRGADLEGASLYRANLARAQLAGANLDGADLRFAHLADAGVYTQEDDYEEAASFEGAQANARTCFPPDIFTGLDEVNEELRGQLEATVTDVHGRELAPADKGYQCPLTFNNVIDDLLQYREGRTYAELADPWKVDVTQIRSLFETPGSVPLRRESLILTRPVCAGATEIALRRTQWEQAGAFALVIKDPDEPLEQTTALPLSTEIGGDFISPVALSRPLKRGSTVILFATPNTRDEGPNYAFVKRSRVRPCPKSESR
jgi:uncharacterized protein YjbI with pentapeptide repeats